jgi:Flp pilus assembly protein TadG
MNLHRKSSIASRARSANLCAAQFTTHRSPGCLFRRHLLFNRDAGSGHVSPVPGLRKLKEEGGNNLIEYALVFMVFISMVLGIVDFSRALYSYHFLSNASREATRWAAVRGSTCGNDGSCAAPASSSDIQTYVTNITPPGLDSANLTTTPSWPGTGPTCLGAANSPGCTVEVQVSYNFNFVVPFIHTSPLTLSSSSEMIIVH